MFGNFLWDRVGRSLGVSLRIIAPTLNAATAAFISPPTSFPLLPTAPNPSNQFFVGEEPIGFISVGNVTNYSGANATNDCNSHFLPSEIYRGTAFTSSGFDRTFRDEEKFAVVKKEQEDSPNSNVTTCIVFVYSYLLKVDSVAVFSFLCLIPLRFLLLEPLRGHKTQVYARGTTSGPSS